MMKYVKIGAIVVVVVAVVILGINYFSPEGDIEYVDGGEEKKDSNIKIVLNNVDVTPGQNFNEKNFTETAKKSTIASCAFEGLDNVYTYNNMEITTNANDKEIVYSVYFINDSISTNENVKIGDTKDYMISKYGDSYTNNGDYYEYTDGKVELLFAVEADKITSIEYKMVLK